MEYEKLLELIKTVSDSNITGLHYETGDVKIVISTVESGLTGIGMQAGNGTQAVFGIGKEHTGELPVAEVKGNSTDNVKVSEAGEVNLISVEDSQVTGIPGNIVKSPLVGTFYAAPSEEAAPFVSVGDHVQVGQTLAIVEAMKLMNDIESEYEGTITQIFVKNGDCVEYGQPLFAIG